MMGIYIKGMEMPRLGMVINIYADGRVTNHYVEDWKESCTKTPISPKDAKTKILDSCPVKDYPIKPNKEVDEFELIEEYYNE